MKKRIKLGLKTIHESGPLKTCHSGTHLLALLFLPLGDVKKHIIQDTIEDWPSLEDDYVVKDFSVDKNNHVPFIVHSCKLV